MAERTQVFISYSHHDTAWLKRLQTHLTPLERAGVINLWDDTRIKPGARWRDEITQALATAKVAVLLVSADFLASDFIAKNELPPLLAAAQQAGARICPVIVSPCLYKYSFLESFQAVNDLKKPLVGLPQADQETILVKLAEVIIENALNSTDPNRDLKVKHNLPQRDYSAFIGRQAQIEKIRSILQPYPKSRHYLVVISGIGGIGKSALALEVAYQYLDGYDRLPLEERFSAIVWTSAKSSELLADKIIKRPQPINNLEDIYNVIAVVLDRKNISSALPGERSELIKKALTERRTLLIVDNLETVVDDESINIFLRELPDPTKAIITTRYKIDVAYPIGLEEMSKEEGLALIHQECIRKQIPLLPTAWAERLYSRTGGIPLAVVLSIGLMGLGHDVDAVLRHLGATTGKICRFLFEKVVDGIRGTDAFKLAIALSLFATDASREALGYVAGLDGDVVSRDEELVKLEMLSLVNKQANRFSLLPLTRDYLREVAKKETLFTQSAFKRMLEYYQQLITVPKRTGVLYWDGLFIISENQILEKEWNNLIDLIQLALDQWLLDEDYYGRMALNLFLPMVHFLDVWGSWNERIQLSRRMCQVAHKLGDEVEAWLWIDAIGYILHQQVQLTECKEALEIGRIVARQFSLHDALVLADVFEAGLYSRVGKMNIAQEKFEMILEQVKIDEAINNECDVLHRIVATRIVDELAYLSLKKDDEIFKREWYEKGLRLRRLTGENVTPALINLVRISIDFDGDLDVAERYLDEAEVTARKSDLPYVYLNRAVLAEKRSQWKQRQYYYGLAAKEFFSLGIIELAKKYEKLSKCLEPDQE